jgi:hypothetical protein
LLNTPLRLPRSVSGKAKRQSFIENIVPKMGQKSLSLKVTLTVEFAMSLVGVVTFFSLVTMMLIQNFTTMIDKIKSVVVGVALVGRMVPNSKL